MSTGGTSNVSYLGFFGVLWTENPKSLAVGLLYWVILLTENAGTGDGKGKHDTSIF